MDNPIPEEVIIVLNEIRQDGLINMFDRKGAIELAGTYGDFDVSKWLKENSERCVEALMAMGDRLDAYGEFIPLEE